MSDKNKETVREPLWARARNKGEVAAYYGVTPRVVNAWLRQYGLGDLVKRSGSYYYTPAELRRMASLFGDCSHQLGLFG